MGFFYQWYQTGGQGKIYILSSCNTDEIEDAQEEKSLITEQMDNQVDAFIIQADWGQIQLPCFGNQYAETSYTGIE